MPVGILGRSAKAGGGSGTLTRGARTVPTLLPPDECMRKTPSFVDRLEQGVILADGAIGTYLQDLGVPNERGFSELCLSNAAIVERVHREYIDAGAEILTTNSYGANRMQLDRVGLADEVRRINVAAARIARQASEGRCYVAGAMGPLGAALAPLGPVSAAAAREIFEEQAGFLAEGGVDLIIIETISDLEEFDVALAAARAVCDLPVVVEKTFTEDGRTLMGELPHEVVERALQGGATVVGANCTVGPQRMVDIIERMAQRARLPLAAMPTAGLPQLVDGHVRYHAEPEYMGRYARRIAEAGAQIVGGCCGSTPAHIAAMGAELEDVKVGSRVAVAAVEAEDGGVEPMPLTERSRLAARLNREFVVAVDVELPRSHDLADAQRYAADLRDAGVDTLMLSDALRSRLVVHPLVVAYRLQRDLDFDCILPFHTRDKNMLGVQSDLLAAHVLGVRNIFAAVSDPASLGDYPTTRQLSDLGADGVVRVMAGMNRGLDLAGNPIGEPTAFVPFVGGDPHAADPGAEVARVEAALASGAVAVVTPPQFAAEPIRAFCEALGPSVPVLVGMLPLRSADHASYLHNEVPGLHVPEDVRRRIREARAPRDEGLAMARELLAALPQVAGGAHIVPPYRKREEAVAALAALEISAVVAAQSGS